MIARHTPLITNHLISKHNSRRIREFPIEYIVMHVSATGGHIEQIARYFSRDVPVLVDYLVENTKIYKLNDSDHFYPWSIGITPESGSLIHNGNVLSVMVMSDPTGRLVSAESLDYAQNLVHSLREEYHIASDNVLRFSDVNPRHSTGVFNNPEIWCEFKRWI